MTENRHISSIGCADKSLKSQHIFMFLCSEKVCCLEDVGILHRARMKICIIEPFPTYGKVGVNKKIFSAWIWVVFEGPNLCALHHLRTNLILGSEKNRLKWKTLKWRTRQYAQFLLFVTAKIWPMGARVFEWTG